MSRKIKFRAWKMRNGKMRRYVCTPFSFMKYAQTHIDEPVMRYSDVSDIQDFMPDADIIEQYTGLKDKNGEEIYEGDIVLDYYDGDDAFIVEWDRDIACFRLTGTDNIASVSFDNFDSDIDLEVIGNIHEDQEMLGGKDV